MGKILKTGIRLIAIAVTAAIAVVVPVVAQTPVRGGSHSYTDHPEPTAMSTIATTAVPVALVATKIGESLPQWEGAEMTPKPGLAASWSRSDDGRA